MGGDDHVIHEDLLLRLFEWVIGFLIGRGKFTGLHSGMIDLYRNWRFGFNSSRVLGACWSSGNLHNILVKHFR